MKETLLRYKKNNGVYLGLFGIIWLILLLFDFEHSVQEGHYLLNSYHAPWLDTFFALYTYIGGGFPFYLAIVWSFFNLRQGSYILITQLVANAISQTIKHFTWFPRPLTLFETLNIPLPPVAEGVELWPGYSSFPSGHTTAIFALFTCIAAITPYKHRSLQALWVFLAFLGAYSRIYLSQHFLRDILMGSVLGAFCAFVIFLLLYKKEWGEFSIVEGFRKLVAKKKQKNEQ